jgi:hypothetical protein
MNPKITIDTTDSLPVLVRMIWGAVDVPPTEVYIPSNTTKVLDLTDSVNFYIEITG